MNPVLHGTLKRIYAFVCNVFFWPITLLFLSVSGWKQVGATVGFGLVSFWIARSLVIVILFPTVFYWYLGTGLVTALVFGYLFGTFKNAIFVYPMLAIFCAWVGVALSLI